MISSRPSIEEKPMTVWQKREAEFGWEVEKAGNFNFYIDKIFHFLRFSSLKTGLHASAGERAQVNAFVFIFVPPRDAAKSSSCNQDFTKGHEPKDKNFYFEKRFCEKSYQAN